jgi:hypothetical protein
MFAIGTKRTFVFALQMSAFGGKADIGVEIDLNSLFPKVLPFGAIWMSAKGQ